MGVRTMTRQKSFLLLIVAISFILVGCGSNYRLAIEQSNAYSWQKYMNEDEFAQLEEGMTYDEVMKIAKGAGKQKAEDVYRWPDEQLMTQAYEIEFKDNKLVKKEIVEIRANSTRGFEKEEASNN